MHVNGGREFPSLFLMRKDSKCQWASSVALSRSGRKICVSHEYSRPQGASGENSDKLFRPYYTSDGLLFFSFTERTKNSRAITVISIQILSWSSSQGFGVLFLLFESNNHFYSNQNNYY